jgi:hypothetical protein
MVAEDGVVTQAPRDARSRSCESIGGGRWGAFLLGFSLPRPFGFLFFVTLNGFGKVRRRKQDLPTDN